MKMKDVTDIVSIVNHKMIKKNLINWVFTQAKLLKSKHPKKIQELVQLSFLQPIKPKQAKENYHLHLELLNLHIKGL
jgi:hypothetical protein